MVRELNIILVFCFMVFIAGCSNDNNEIIPVNYDYFPADTGLWFIYQVEKIEYIDNEIRESSYQLKEVMESLYKDNEGRSTYRIERYTRSSDTADWEIADVWALNLLVDALHKVEENIRYVKLKFPVRQGAEWDGNAYNTMTESNYEIVSMDESLIINSILFDETLTVIQQDELSLIHKKYYVEKYAKNTGLVYKEIIDVATQNTNDQIPLIDRVEEGTIYTQTIISYGSN